MALKIVNSESLDAVANALNESAGTTGAINFPDGFVEKIGELGSKKLAGLIKGEVGELTEKDFGNATKLKTYAFYAGGVTKAELPDTIETLESYAFCWNSQMKSIKLSKNCHTMKAYAFNNCDSLTKLELPDTLTTVGARAFSEMKALKELRIPNGVTELLEGVCWKNTSMKVFDLTAYGTDKNFPTLANVSAFQYTPADMKILVPIGRKSTLAGMTNWSSFASQILEFDKNVGTEGVTIDYNDYGTMRICSGLEDYVEDPYIVIPTDYEGEPILATGAYAFKNNTNIVKMYLNNVETIGAYTFENCSNLTYVDSPNVKLIGYASFSGSGISTLDLPNLVEMGSDSCVGCANLERANLGKVSAVTSWTFTRCSALKTLILPNTAKISTLQATNAFDGTPIASGNGYIYVPRALIESYKTATNWSNFASQFRAIEDYPNI